MIEPDYRRIPVKRQCELLGLNRATLYYRPKPKSDRDMDICEKIINLFIDRPYYGRRRISVTLTKEGTPVSVKKAARLMRRLGLLTIYPKKGLSQPAGKFRKEPYWLGDLFLDRPNLAWATDITYLRLSGGFVYLVAILDLYSRRVLSWRLSNSLDAGFCVEALQEAIDKYGPPFLFNMDQGAQFTGGDFRNLLEKNDIIISMDGKGRAFDNILVERFWRSIKYEGFYPMGFETMKELKVGIEDWVCFYNDKRYHQSLGYFTPSEVYFGGADYSKKIAA